MTLDLYSTGDAKISLFALLLILLVSVYLRIDIEQSSTQSLSDTPQLDFSLGLSLSSIKKSVLDLSESLKDKVRKPVARSKVSPTKDPKEKIIRIIKEALKPSAPLHQKNGEKRPNMYVKKGSDLVIVPLNLLGYMDKTGAKDINNPINKLHPILAFPFKKADQGFDILTDIAAATIDTLIVYPIRLIRYYKNYYF